MRKRKIGWEPFHFDFNKFREENEEDKEKDKEYSDNYDEDKQKKPGWVMQTPFGGVYRVDDTMNPFKRFNFWMGHTNFNLGKKANRTIRMCPGVEVYIPITRYRFIIGIGKAFIDQKTGAWEETRVEIERRTCGQHMYAALISQIIDKEVLSEIEKSKEALSKFPYWVMYIMPNGHIESMSSDIYSDKFRKRVILLNEAQKISGGVLITSDDIDEQACTE